jgi:acyl carrier protein
LPDNQPEWGINVQLTQAQCDKVREITCQLLEIAPKEIGDDSHFVEDYDADSLLAIEILAALEKHFKISIPQNELERMVNLEGVYVVVAEAIARKG